MKKTLAALVVAAVALLAPLTLLLPVGTFDAPATEAQTVPAFRDVAAAWEAPPYAEDFTGPCRPRLLRTVVRHDLLALALDPCPLPSTTLSYGAPSTTGAITGDGDYAFLSDPDDLTSAVTTYEGLRDGSTTGLVIHQNDSAGASQAAFYNMVQAGDLVEWRQAGDCFVRYTVTDAPAPAAGATARAFGVAWMTYAFTGCSGAIAATSADFRLGALPSLGGTSLTAPVIHGIFQIVPDGWTGATEPSEVLPPPRPKDPLSHLDTLEEARKLRYWREPTLPAGWTLWSASCCHDSTPYGYDAYYADENGRKYALIIIGRYASELKFPRDAAVRFRSGRNEGNALDALNITETLMIAGRPATIFSSNLRSVATLITVYDQATETQYELWGGHKDLKGENVGNLIAIATSLFEPPNAP